MKISHIATIAATFILSLSTNAQSASTKDPLQSLAFLQGTWKANTNANGSSGGAAAGTYTFALDLNGHALQRTSSVDRCSGPELFRLPASRPTHRVRGYVGRAVCLLHRQ